MAASRLLSRNIWAKDPATGGDISIRLGPYGPYVQLDLPESAQPKIEEPVAEVVEEKPAKATKGKKKAAKPKKPKKVAAPKPKRASLPKGLTIEATTLEKALELLALPRLVGNHPETGDKIEANNGRFGPYLKYQSMFVSIPKGEDLFTIGMNRAVDLIAIKKEKIANGTLKTFGRGKPKAAKGKTGQGSGKEKSCT
jgi:DNA topoisomerase-1